MSHRDDAETPSGSDDGEGDRPKSKVARLIAAYELGGAFGQRLEDAWTAEGAERESLRSLADTFNRELLRSAMTDAGLSPISGEVDNLYRLLTGDVSSGSRAEARTRLEQEGIDVERLDEDFVTYQAIRSYLREYRGAEYESDETGPRVETVTETVQRLQSRTASVVENSLDRLGGTDRLSLGTFRVFVDVNVLCEDCNTRYPVTELLNRGGCECERE